MKWFSTKLGLGLALSGALVVAAACGPDSIQTATAPDLAVAADHVTDGYGHIEVCKAGVGSGSFTVVSAGTVDGTITMPGPFTLAAGECVEVADVNLIPGVNTIVEVSITETPDPGFLLNPAVEVFEAFIGGSQAFTIANGDKVTAGDDGRVTVTFTNEAEPPPPPGMEGCTPGYWKNLKKHGDAWSADPDAPVSSIFSGASSVGLGDASLHEGLKFQGGNTFEEKSEILLRAAIAAWLNASSADVDYPMTADMIVSEVNAALASGDSDVVLALARQLDEYNNLGCPI